MTPADAYLQAMDFVLKNIGIPVSDKKCHVVDMMAYNPYRYYYSVYEDHDLWHYAHHNRPEEENYLRAYNYSKIEKRITDIDNDEDGMLISLAIIGSKYNLLDMIEHMERLNVEVDTIFRREDLGPDTYLIAGTVTYDAYRNELLEILKNRGWWFVE